MDEVAHQLVVAFGFLNDQGELGFHLFQVYFIYVVYTGHQGQLSLVTGCPLGYGM
jgi:hypothetical protein